MKKISYEDIQFNGRININELRCNPWNPKNKRSGQFKKVRESIERNGQLQPIVVRELVDEDYRYEVIDGEQRLTAMLDLGYTEVWVISLGELDDDDARAKTVWMEQSVPFDDQLLGQLLIELDGKIELPYTHDEIELIAGALPDEEPEEEAPELPPRTHTYLKLRVHCDDAPEYQQDLTTVREYYKLPDDEAIIAVMFSRLMSDYMSAEFAAELDTAAKLINDRSDANVD